MKNAYFKASNIMVDMVKEGMYPDTFYATIEEISEPGVYGSKEINAKGGVLGKQIEVVQEDGASEPQIFFFFLRKLIQSDKVATIFGCWTSASRKAVKPVVEETGALLWYPVQYEGMEMSPNIMYMGAAPNQQAVPAVDFCSENFGKNIFLVGSDYVFPRTANKIIKEGV